MTCDPNPKPLDHLAARVSSDPYFLGSALASYQQRHGLDDAVLAAVPGCAPAVLTLLRLCRWPGAAVAVIELNMPRHWLRKSRRGLWYCRRDIPASRFRRVSNFAELAGPSTDEKPAEKRPRLALAG
jgi:hypothetical protein